MSDSGIIRSQNKNLKRGGQPGRKKGVPNKSTYEIRRMATAWTTGDKEWVESARQRMKDGKAPHLEIYLLQMAYGRPRDTAPPPPSGATVNILALLGSMPVEKLKELEARLDDDVIDITE